MLRRVRLAVAFAAALLAALPAEAGRAFLGANFGSVSATASFISGATSIAVGTGQTFIMPGAVIYDNTLGYNVATVVSYPGGTTIYTTPTVHASSGSADSLRIGSWLNTLGGVRAQAAFLQNATSITVGAGLTFLTANEPIYDATLGLNVGSTTGYLGTTLSTTALTSASSGGTDDLIVGSTGIIPCPGVPYACTSFALVDEIALPASNNQAVLVEGSLHSSVNSQFRLYIDSSAGADPQVPTGEDQNHGGPTGSFHATSKPVTSSPAISVPAGLTFIVPGMNVYDTTVSLNLGTVLSYSGTTLTLTGNSANNGSATTDNLGVGFKMAIGSYEAISAASQITAATSYKAGALNGTSTYASRTFAVSIDVTSIGNEIEQSWAFPCNCNIAHAAYWNIALTQGEEEPMGVGLPPYFIRPQAITAYWPLTDGNAAVENDYSGLNHPMFVAGLVPLAGNLLSQVPLKTGQTIWSRAYLSPTMIGKRPMNLALPLVGLQ